jgi:cell shape-determining protein MreD
VIYYITLPFFLLLFVVLQHSVPRVLFLNSINLEISLIVVIYAGFRLDIIKGIVLTLILGFIMDCISGAISGFYTSIYFFLFSLSFLISPRIYAESPVSIAFTTLICGLLEGLLIVVLNYLLYGVNLLYDTFCFFFPQLIVVSAISPVLFKFFDRFGIFYGGYARSAKRA